MNFIWAIISVASYFGLEVHQIYPKSDFLYGNFIEYISMEKPTGFEKDGNIICWLDKSLSGVN